jgi:hypothetical protein
MVEEQMIEPHTAGYADVNGINLYHEIYGTGEPLVLLHGGLMTIPEMEVLLHRSSRNSSPIRCSKDYRPPLSG